MPVVLQDAGPGGGADYVELRAVPGRDRTWVLGWSRRVLCPLSRLSSASLLLFPESYDHLEQLSGHHLLLDNHVLHIIIHSDFIHKSFTWSCGFLYEEQLWCAHGKPWSLLPRHHPTPSLILEGQVSDSSTQLTLALKNS